MSTDTSTTTGWMPTALAMTRGWMMFMTTNQPMPMTTSVGMTTSGLVRTATTTGGAQEKNGPKNGIIWSTPDEGGGRGQEVEPKTRWATAAMMPVDQTLDRLAADEAAERCRHARLEQARLSL